MAQSRPFLGRLEPFYGWYKRVSRQCSEPQNRHTNRQITEIKIVTLRP